MRYTVDLSAQAEDRWDEVIRRRRAGAKRLMKAAWDDVATSCAPIVSSLLGPLSWLVSLAHRAVGGPYREEMAAWAEATDTPLARVVALNLSYELSRGCTSVVKWCPGLGMVHARHVDWDVDGLDEHTIVVDFENGDAGPFTAVTWPGYVGVLSGVAKGRFAITLNSAPHDRGLNPRRWPPTVVIRKAFEDCSDFDEAVEFICGHELLVNALITVSGPKRGQAVTIEALQDNHELRWMERGVLATANHFECEELEHLNDEGIDDGGDSILRSEAAADRAAKKVIRKLSDGFALLNRQPTLHEGTKQRMVLCAKSGEALVR